MARKVKVVPSAHRLIQSLRDIGYDFSTAVADLIDNSVAAGATEVRIDYEFEGMDTWFRIADNGTGMPPGKMDEALRFGARRDYGELELGKFGLGLKTASLSQCQRLTVSSRTVGGRIGIRQWDLEHIEQTDEWELLHPTTAEVHREATAPLRRTPHGTVVFWERLDRILGYTLPAGKSAQNGFIKMCSELHDHLAMVFHRFLSGKAKRKLPLAIYFNDHPIDAWDPFAISEPKTQTLRSSKLGFEHEGVKSHILVQPCILPPESGFSSGTAHRQAGGPKGWNDQQGFYIYRNDRMLQSGGWSRMRKPDEHVKLARIAVDFPPSADAAFKLNVSKMGIHFPMEVRDRLGELVREVTRRADETYRKKERSVSVHEGGRSQGHAPAGTGEGVQRRQQSAGTISSTTAPEGLKGQAGDARPGEPKGGSQAAHGTEDTVNRVMAIAAGATALTRLVLEVLREELRNEPQRLSRVLKKLGDRHEAFRQLSEQEGETA